jgi:hypothetical protein
MVQVIGGMWILGKLISASKDFNTEGNLLTRFVPIGLAALCFGGIWLALTFMNWRDDFKDRILQGLIADSEGNQRESRM